jgi:hypothetical protein
MQFDALNQKRFDGGDKLNGFVRGRIESGDYQKSEQLLNVLRAQRGETLRRCRSDTHEV